MRYQLYPEHTPINMLQFALDTEVQSGGCSSRDQDLLSPVTYLLTYLAIVLIKIELKHGVHFLLL